MRVVLDTNVLLSTLGKSSRFKDIWQAFISGKYKLIITNDIFLEYHEVLNKATSPAIALVAIEVLLLSRHVIHKQVSFYWNIIKFDPDDNKFFDAAVAGNADYIVTNDAHFNIAKSIDFPQVNIISAEEFLSLIRM